MLHEGWAVGCQIGLWGWIASTVVFIITTFPARGRFERKAALRWGSVLSLFFILWILGMVQA